MLLGRWKYASRSDSILLLLHLFPLGRYIFWATLASVSLSKLLYTNQVAVTTSILELQCLLRTEQHLHGLREGHGRGRKTATRTCGGGQLIRRSALLHAAGCMWKLGHGAETRVMQFPITLTASLFHQDDNDDNNGTGMSIRNMEDTLFHTQILTMSTTHALNCIFPSGCYNKWLSLISQ